MSSVKKVAALAVSTAVLLGAAACSKGGSSAPAAEGEAVTLEAWTHAAGNKEELAGYKAIIDAFNGSQSKYKVELKEFPGDSYNKTVVAAAAAKKLPCLLDVDQPNVANWAWAGYLAPLEGMDDRLAQFMPNAVAKWNDKAYAYGFFDVSLTWVSRKSVLKKYDMRVPTVDQPWTQDEFMAGLKKMKASGDYKFPADMATGWTGEWWSYGFAPQLQSFGGDQINRTDYKSAAGVLNGPQAVTWAKWFAGMASEGYIAKKSGADPVQDFLNGKTALLWNGSWAAPNARKKFGDDVVFAPPVDFGTGPKVSGGSWGVGPLHQLLRPRGRDGVPEVRGRRQVGRQAGRRHREHPDHRGRRGAGRGLRPRWREPDLPRLPEEVPGDAPGDPRLHLHLHRVRQDRAGHPERRRSAEGARPGGSQHRREPVPERLLPVVIHVRTPAAPACAGVRIDPASLANPTSEGALS